MKKFAVVLVSLLVVACQTPPKKDTAAADTGPTRGTSTSTAGTTDGGTSLQEMPGPAQSVYFDYATSAIAPEYVRVIQNDAQAVKSSGEVTLEGNCDERGSAEYNLGLGQRRADEVKKLLVVAGLPASRIKTTSLGKEKPKATCHDESCWKENRRVDFAQGS